MIIVVVSKKSQNLGKVPLNAQNGKIRKIFETKFIKDVGSAFKLLCPFTDITVEPEDLLNSQWVPEKNLNLDISKLTSFPGAKRLSACGRPSTREPCGGLVE